MRGDKQYGPGTSSMDQGQAVRTRDKQYGPGTSSTDQGQAIIIVIIIIRIIMTIIIMCDL